MGYSMTTERYHYVQWHNWDNDAELAGEQIAVELYDHQVDPDENINIAGHRRHSKPTIQNLSNRWVNNLELVGRLQDPTGNLPCLAPNAIDQSHIESSKATMLTHNIVQHFNWLTLSLYRITIRVFIAGCLDDPASEPINLTQRTPKFIETTCRQNVSTDLDFAQMEQVSTPILCLRADILWEFLINILQ